MSAPPSPQPKSEPRHGNGRNREPASRVLGSWLVCRSVLVVGSVGGGWDGAGVRSARLREWRGVKAVAAPSGVAIGTRLRTSADDERVLDLVAEHLGRLRRADLT